jgi:D-3-phosphoglycerate dehydrogenase / 2-oxoglutarate reductase
MKTLVVEPMPDLFLQKVDENGWREYFVTETSDDIEILIIRTKTQADKMFMARFPKLKAIIRAGTGFDNIDVHEAVKRNIAVFNTPQANALSAAEHTISFIFALLKQHQIAKEKVLNKSWKGSMNNCWELSDLKVLLVGMGRVGSRVAKILQSLGADVRGVDPYISEAEWLNKNIEITSYQDGINWCNMLSFHCPLYKDTEHYFNTDILSKFINPFWLINTARGKIVQEQAVVQGLKNKQILGFAADVFANEPWMGNVFASYTNVYLSPHIGAYTLKAKNRLLTETLQVWKELVFHGKITNSVDLKFCY